MRSEAAASASSEAGPRFTQTPHGETSEQIEHIPASFHVVRTIRGKYACPGCQTGVAIAPPPAQALEKSVAGPGLIAHVVASKVADHLPLYRQEEIYARAGVEIARSTLGDLMAQAAVRLDTSADGTAWGRSRGPKRC